MPLVYKTRPKHRFNSVRKKSRSTPPPPSTPIKESGIGINSVFSAMFQGFSFGAGSQIAREAFSGSGGDNNEIVNSDTSGYKDDCDTLKKQLLKCSDQSSYGCEYLVKYIDSKCDYK